MADAFDYSTLQPSATGRNAISLADLFSNRPRETVPGHQNFDEYMRKMQYLTQPAHDMGPDARRAAALMPVAHGAGPDPVQLQQTPAGQSLMALLFGGLGR